MGRGLSDLQKTILKLAYKNHIEEQRTLPTYKVVLVERIPSFREKVAKLREKMKESVFSRDEWDRLYDEAERVEREAIQLAETRLCLKLAGMELIRPPHPYHGEAFSRGWMVIDFETHPTIEEAHTRCTQLKAYGIEAEVKGEYGSGADLYTYEILRDVYGFDAYRKEQLGGPAPYYWKGWNMRATYGRFFDREKIGHERYNSAVVSVSRACGRLEERGLVIRMIGVSHQSKDGEGRDVYQGRWHGINLTPKGLETAEKLLDNTDYIITSIIQ